MILLVLALVFGGIFIVVLTIDHALTTKLCLSVLIVTL